MHALDYTEAYTKHLCILRQFTMITYTNVNVLGMGISMKILNEIQDAAISPDYINTLIHLALPNQHCTIADLLFFDIETTGFSANSCICYLIGYVYYKDSKWNYCQLFAELPEEEASIINEFYTVLKQYSIIAHFNGDGFDIPFLQKRSQHLGLSFDLAQKISIDLYKYAKKAHKLLKLEQYKQKSIEKFIGINRTDIFSGGDLIQVYKTYVKKHLLKENCKKEQPILLCHNKDDICALPQLSTVMLYTLLPEIITFAKYEWVLEDIKDYSGNIVKVLTFTITMPECAPTEVSYGKEPFYIKITDSLIRFRICLYIGELRHFYKNYKDYYYLPAEDTAIHKSVAFYVDKNFRIQAKAATCYLRKKGIFVPQLSPIISPEFIENISDKTSYFEFSESFCNDKAAVQKYIKAAIKDMLFIS